jgi:hypothetical protein
MRFRRDTAVWDRKDKEIGLMVLDESPSGTRVCYLARTRWHDGRYRYAYVQWDGNAGQFQANSAFAGGFTGDALNYVARWYRSPSRVLPSAFQ